MIRFCWGILLVFIMAACDKENDMAIRIHLNGEIPGAIPVLVMNDSIYNIVFDSTGLARVPLSGFIKPGYGYFCYGKIELPMYIENKSFHLTLTIKENVAVPEFSGEGARKNKYLVTTVVTGTFSPDYRLGEREFVLSLEDQLNKYYAVLDTFHFDLPFVQLEKRRLYYTLFSLWSDYPVNHRRQGGIPGDTLSSFYYDYLGSLIKEDRSLAKLFEYKRAIDKFIRVYSIKDLQNPCIWEIMKARVDYVDKNISIPDLSSYLVDKYVTEYVRQAGFNRIDEAISLYYARVGDPKLRAGFDELCAIWAKMAKGRPSPSFSLTDINGTEVSLSDLSGKYVYIGIWDAKYPSYREEFAFLQKLGRRYKDKDIYFVSISCEKDTTIWKETIKKERWDGIQLHIGADTVFIKDYMVKKLPRYILLDKEGRILDAGMSSPSDVKTQELLDELEGIKTVEIINI